MNFTEYSILRFLFPMPLNFLSTSASHRPSEAFLFGPSRRVTENCGCLPCRKPLRTISSAFRKVATNCLDRFLQHISIIIYFWATGIPPPTSRADLFLQTFSDAASAQTAVAATDQGHIIGEAAPLWVPDERVTKCQLCHTAFTFTKRRHHCRACGKAVCGDCSRGRAPLKYKNYEVARVCNDCFDEILESKSI